MVNIMDVNELSKGKFLGRGTYGSVYRYNDCAAKIYHDIIYAPICYKNPCSLRKKELLTLKEKCKDLKHISHIQDVVCDENKVIAVLYEFQEGNTLDNVIDTSTFNEKMTICHDIISGSKYLSKKHIYPLDYKLNNAIYDGTNAVLIDLDDVFTKVKNIYHPILCKISLFSLKELIVGILNGDQYLLNNHIRQQLGVYKENQIITECFLCSYHSIENFLVDRSEVKNIIFLNDDFLNETDIIKLKKLIDALQLKVVLINDLHHATNIKFEKFNQIQIPIYDIYINNKSISEKIEQCLNNYNVNYYLINGYLNESLNEPIEYYINKYKIKRK
jgi:serine/threonine protein kinase